MKRKGERGKKGEEKGNRLCPSVSYAWKIMLATLHDSSILEELTAQQLVNRKYYIVKQYKIPHTVINTI